MGWGLVNIIFGFHASFLHGACGAVRLPPSHEKYYKKSRTSIEELMLKVLHIKSENQEVGEVGEVVDRSKSKRY